MRRPEDPKTEDEMIARALAGEGHGVKRLRRRPPSEDHQAKAPSLGVRDDPDPAWQRSGASEGRRAKSEGWPSEGA